MRAVKCECGGLYVERIGGYIYDQDTHGVDMIAKANFRCSKCGKVIMLEMKYFPCSTYKLKSIDNM